MPAKSGPQYRLMAMVAHDPAAAARTGISQDVAEEFVHKTPPAKRKQFARKGWGRRGHK